MTNSNTVVSRAMDKFRESEYAIAVTDFMTPAEIAEVYSNLITRSGSGISRCFFWGGCRGAERCTAVFLPEWYLPEPDAPRHALPLDTARRDAFAAHITAMVRGDRDVNEVKLKNLVGCTDDLELAEPAIVREITRAQVGFAGPVDLGIPVYADKEVELMKNFVVGANETDMHYKNVNMGRDFTPDVVADIRVVVTGDKCPKCGGTIKSEQGIEVGHIFKLGTKYSDALGLKYLDESGKQQTVIMGCYGIGVTRCVAAAVEQLHDDNGIIWPVSIAPYQAIVVPANYKDEEQMMAAEKLYNELCDAGIETLLDDRSERAGVKFKDADLIGIPVRVVVGKKLGEGIVEYKERKMENAVEIAITDAVSKVTEFVKANK